MSDTPQLLTPQAAPIWGSIETHLFQIDHDRAVLATTAGQMEGASEKEFIQKIVDEVVLTGCPKLKQSGQPDQLCWLAIPTIYQNRVRSVVVFTYLQEYLDASALEIWCLEEGRAELKLADGLYGNLSHFGSISTEVNFPIGVGLPGKTWSTGRPRFLRPLGETPEFVRAIEAQDAGLDTGVGFPIFGTDFEVQSVLLLLSSPQAPFASEFQILSEADGRVVQRDALTLRQDRLPSNRVAFQKLIIQEAAGAIEENRIRLLEIPTEFELPSGHIVSLPVPSQIGTASVLVLICS